MGKDKREGNSGPKVDPSAWMATLSDLVFLLITFFVLLITMSSLDAKQLKDTFGFFDDATGVLKFSAESLGSNRVIDVLSPLATFVASKDIEKTKPLVGDRRMAAENFIRGLVTGMSSGIPPKTLMGSLKPLAGAVEGEVKIQKTSEGIQVVLSSKLLFPDGKTELDDKGRSLLGDIASIVKLWGGEVDVIATWSWHEGPKVLAQVAETMERNAVKGESLNPVLYPGMERAIRFVLRKRS